MTPLLGTTVTLARLNVRRGRPSTDAPIAAKVEPGTTLAVHGLADGEIIGGNGQWYAGDDDTFFWSGACGGFEPADAGSAGRMEVRRRGNGTIRPLGDAEIRSMFGDIAHTELGDGRVRLDPEWVNENIAELEVPALADKGFPSIKVHAKAREPFRRVFEALARADLAPRILTCGGTFVPRHKGWSAERDLSAHSWGIAIDLNVAWNGYGCVPAPLGAIGSVRELVPFFEAEGFAWGGYFEPAAFADGMHFELARLDL